jgi:CheY-like chemotaxis protein
MSKTILIVDDNNLIRQSLTAALVSNELIVESANNGKDGLKLALEKHPDLVVTDVHMPEMDGLEMIEKLRADEWGKKVPVLIMTIDEEAESINKALSAGVTTYMSKNVSDPASIVEQIKIALG